MNAIVVGYGMCVLGVLRIGNALFEARNVKLCKPSTTQDPLSLKEILEKAVKKNGEKKWDLSGYICLSDSILDTLMYAPLTETSEGSLTEVNVNTLHHC